jgi:hypothetical protein
MIFFWFILLPFLFFKNVTSLRENMRVFIRKKIDTKKKAMRRYKHRLNNNFDSTVLSCRVCNMFHEYEMLVFGTWN